MIKITAYLRSQEDLVKWRSIENKAEWLHRALNPLNSVQGISKQIEEIEATPDPNLSEPSYEPLEDVA